MEEGKRGEEEVLVQNQSIICINQFNSIQSNSLQQDSWQNFFHQKQNNKSNINNDNGGLCIFASCVHTAKFTVCFFISFFIQHRKNTKNSIKTTQYTSQLKINVDKKQKVTSLKGFEVLWMTFHGMIYTKLQSASSLKPTKDQIGFFTYSCVQR